MLRSIESTDIEKAAIILQNGGIVAFPTETVYGLGADAFNAQAVKRVYTVKGRPSDNPLILHVNDIKTAQTLTADLSKKAVTLMQAFWHGPLTLVLAKNSALPPWVGGHPDGVRQTVAVRSPANAIAQQLIQASGCIIAAPSANKAGTPSPTQAEHVASDFMIPEQVDFLLDGGRVEGGLESTVVDMTDDTPRILRPGAITYDMLRDVLGNVEYAENAADAPRSPGQKYKHYAPKAPMTLVAGSPEQVARIIAGKANKERKIGILTTTQNEPLYTNFAPFVLSMGDRDNLAAVAHSLYACLRRFDQMGVDEIFAEAVPDTGLGRAIMNRMTKAAEGRIIYE